MNQQLLGICEWLHGLRNRPVVVIGKTDDYLYQQEHGTLVALGIDKASLSGYEAYRTEIRLIGAALRERGLHADYVAYWPVQHMWGKASQAILQYPKQVWIRSRKIPLREAESI